MTNKTRPTFRFFFLAVASTMGIASPGISQEKKLPPTLTAEQVANPDFKSLPSPTELLEAAVGATEIDWSAVATAIKKEEDAFAADFPLDEQKAINLGIQVANAFVALYASDEELLEQSAGAVEKLASELGAEAPIERMSESIRSLASQGRWHEARQRVETLRVEILKELSSFGDQTSVSLANVGGWLRGAQLVSGYVSENYSEGGGGLLRQSALVADLIEKLNVADMTSDSVKALVAALVEGLGEIKGKTTTDPETPVSAENTKSVSALANRLVAKAQG